MILNSLSKTIYKSILISSIESIAKCKREEIASKTTLAECFYEEGDHRCLQTNIVIHDSFDVAFRKLLIEKLKWTPRMIKDHPGIVLCRSFEHTWEAHLSFIKTI